MWASVATMDADVAKYPVKLIYKGERRRFSVDLKGAADLGVEIAIRVKDFVKDADVALFYVDDEGDVVRLNPRGDELAEATRLNPRLLRIIITDGEQPAALSSTMESADSPISGTQTSQPQAYIDFSASGGSSMHEFGRHAGRVMGKLSDGLRARLEGVLRTIMESQQAENLSLAVVDASNVASEFVSAYFVEESAVRDGVSDDVRREFRDKLNGVLTPRFGARVAKQLGDIAFYALNERTVRRLLHRMAVHSLKSKRHGKHGRPEGAHHQGRQQRGHSLPRGEGQRAHSGFEFLKSRPWESDAQYGVATTSVPPPPLQKGSSGSAVMHLQFILIKLHVLKPPHVQRRVGYFGPRTAAAVKEMQTSQGLSNADGYDEATAERLAQLWAAFLAEHPNFAGSGSAAGGGRTGCVSQAERQLLMQFLGELPPPWRRLAKGPHLAMLMRRLLTQLKRPVKDELEGAIRAVVHDNEIESLRRATPATLRIILQQLLWTEQLSRGEDESTEQPSAEGGAGVEAAAAIEPQQPPTPAAQLCQKLRRQLSRSATADGAQRDGGVTRGVAPQSAQRLARALTRMVTEDPTHAVLVDIAKRLRQLPRGAAAAKTPLETLAERPWTREADYNGESAPQPPLERGASGPRVMHLQSLLLGLKFLRPEQIRIRAGRYAGQTEAAVRALQEQSAIVGDVQKLGMYDALTAATLESLVQAESAAPSAAGSAATNEESTSMQAEPLPSD